MKKFIFLLLTGLIFGSQFLVTKIALTTYSPLAIGLMRVLFGMITVAILVPFLSKEPHNQSIRWYHYAVIGLLEGTLPCVLVPWGQQQVASGIAAVIISTMPIFAMLFGPLLVRSEQFHWINLVSILAGFIGVCVLVNPRSDGYLFMKLIPELSIVLASASWALSLVLIKCLPHECPFVMTRNILLASTIEIVPILLIFGHSSDMQFALVPFISALLLRILGSGVVYIFYVLLIRLAGVNFAAFSNYLVPIVGGLIGVSFLRETFSLHQFVGFIIIFVGLIIQSVYEHYKDKPI